MRKVWLSYLKKNIGNMVFYPVFAGIVYLVLYLYGVRTDALSYLVLLLSFAFLVAGVLGYIRYSRHFDMVSRAVRALPEEMGELPKAAEATEQCYQDVLLRLYEEKVSLESGMCISRQEMQDYYSLWAHQIKTPLAAMNLILQSMQEAGREERAAAEKELKLELFKTEQYVDMVLTYLRMEDMSSDMMLCWYKMDTLIRQAVRKYSQMFILKKIKLNYTPGDAMALTDEKWMVFVLEQILSNALKYTKSGAISIYMEEGAEHTLVIEDTGMGISAEDLPRVFEKGFTGYNGRQDKKSTGIGLYLCKSICEKLGHTISIASTPGEGTKVYIDLSRREIHFE